MGHHQALHNRVNELAADIGRLRRNLDRITDNVETLAQMLEPTAAELAATTAPGDDQAIEEAIRVVDARHRQLQHQLGQRP